MCLTAGFSSPLTPLGFASFLTIHQYETSYQAFIWQQGTACVLRAPSKTIAFNQVLMA